MKTSYGHNIHADSFAHAWELLLDRLIGSESKASPRGLGIRELTAVSLHVGDGLQNILVCPSRNPSYKFMLAEFLWILAGRNDTWSISQFNKNILKFSDNGESFFGAYGPRVRQQLNYLLSKLMEDRDSRQAVLSIWERNPPATKDVPCTLTFQVLIRDGKVNSIINMRSSDIWLGLPYDFFNFSMLTNLIAASFKLPVGSVTFNLGSSHLYDSNYEAAQAVASASDFGNLPSPWLGRMIALHEDLYDPRERATEIVVQLENVFRSATVNRAGREHRETLETSIASPYFLALMADTNQEALSVLTSIVR